MARAPPPSPVLVAAQERTIRHATSALFAIFAPSAASTSATADDRPSLSACLSCGARSPATIAQTLARSHLAGLGSQVTWHWNPRVQAGVRRNARPPAGPPVALFPGVLAAIRGPPPSRLIQHVCLNAWNDIPPASPAGQTHPRASWCGGARALRRSAPIRRAPRRNG